MDHTGSLPLHVCKSSLIIETTPEMLCVVFFDIADVVVFVCVLCGGGGALQLQVLTQTLGYHLNISHMP